MSKIKVLDNLTIQKIAAGEVIERPASIVKELIENSIDAGGSQIVIEISDAGKDFIRITDNGEGMDESDLKLAFERHTTSKLFSVEDLGKILTMGFRGEALSSICAVSKIEVLTRQKEMDAGIMGFVEDGVLKSITPTGAPVGTTMIIRKLFYNLPVRKRFMKSKVAEENAITETVTRLAVGNPSISFKYIKDNRVIYITTGTGSVKNTILQLLGKELASGLKKVSISTEDFKIDGHISDNNLYRSNRHHQYLYVNGRYVVDYRLSKIVEKQYNTLIPINRYPVFVLFIEIDPSNVDVNIHPTKQEIKFTNDTNIYQKLEAALRNNIDFIMRIPNVDLKQKLKAEKEIHPSIWDIESTNNDVLKVENDNEDTIDEKSIVFVDYSSKGLEIVSESDGEWKETQEEYNKPRISLTSLRTVGTAFKTYIITEDVSASKLYIIDQHAAHERIMYERLLKEFKNESIHVQQLLQPVVLDLGQTEHNTVMDNIEHFKKIGFLVEGFGDKSVMLRGVPLIFGSPDNKRLFLDLLDQMDEKFSSSYETRIEKIIKLACTSAIKAGDSVADIEANALLSQLEDCDNPYTCPHGRPTIIEMTRKELEKRFLRVL
ncbi:DNA mismatch repair endonuclease MutL [Gudongella sp. DL1XJH-153]|uniref:DNA mismatch repair endonuclease MutL n=1 Tax=Gudongella sp. DL1XJH-153 TaxID=3409804 RepID=UPI003BB7407B